LGLLVRLMSALAVNVPDALVGGWVGGTYAAISSVAFTYAAEWDRKSAQQADEVVNEAQRSAGLTPDELDAWAQSDVHLRLLVGVVEASMRTRDGDKLRALKVVLAEGFVDEARIHIATLLADALREIEAPHVTVLDHMAQRPPGDTRMWGLEELEGKLPRLAEGMGPLLAALQRTGCILSGSGFGGGVSFVVTNFGREFLTYVKRGSQTLP
jgi:hypothetical protein